MENLHQYSFIRKLNSDYPKERRRKDGTVLMPFGYKPNVGLMIRQGRNMSRPGMAGINGGFGTASFMLLNMIVFPIQGKWN